MKIFTRSESQGVVIDGKIHVTILEILETSVRVAIHSPDVPGSYREETIGLSAEQAGSLVDPMTVEAEPVGYSMK
ncbi:carbon storage regulator [Thalassoroseus pseudoceratinae]|uniref:carbon storage regulator n=1 Tax=Thalassoroseus pseudoceratinae TaxID=2713176 RepID=UPI0014229B06|nr:carbon storage regulator [Thalassoroseus pseudoceratinae]